ncbi:hypothetical protein Ocin01_14907 [Orchesella cincta]|uniref:Uncharacterized protein n=1 Tax=Orchesella cincta TaxID=48709 RepID=A0A1D2MFV6_ORCCI|nr:hypothetical protein Ocin01_14907 [Orchesella cincta]
MLRFLSNYLFQNENEPNEDPTATINQNPNDVKEQPSQQNDLEGPTKPMDLEEGNNLNDDDDEDQDEDWVLIGDGEKKPEEDTIDGNVSKLTSAEDVALVAPNDDDEEGQEDEESVQEQGNGLLWENKLIEHPSMSVYIDLAQSLTNGATSCMSLSSIAPATSPGESVIVLEHDDGESEDDDEMDILETIEVVQMELPKESLPAPKKSPPTPAAPVQNGRRKKGHYPCSSSNTGNMPRRHNVRNSKAFQMISSSSTPPSSPDLNEEERNRVTNSKKKRGNPAPTTPAVNQPTTACGIAMGDSPGGVNGPTSALGHHSSNMLNKNIKLLDLFPAKGSHSRKMEAQKLGATARGHHLQEGRRRLRPPELYEALPRQ